MKILGHVPLVAALGLFGCAPVTHVHTNSSASEPANAVVVIGSGEATSTPDIARITLGVEAQNGNPEAAVSEVNKKMKAVIEVLKKKGIADKDVRTANLNIFMVETPPHYPMPMPMSEPAPMPGPPGMPPATAKAPPVFRASNSVLITLRQLDKVGDTLGAAIQAGANQAWGITFEMDDPKPLRAKARAKAVEDARARAEELARASGVKLGRVLSIGEMGGSEPQPPGVPGFQMGYARAEAMQSVPIERGEITLTQNVRVTFELAD
jgi:uncharacterized protein